MTKGSVDRQPNAIGSHPISPENENQAAERRWLEEGLEDDEVYEAMASLRAARMGRDRSRPP
jgi:isopentenyldiphosphate isomerase